MRKALLLFLFLFIIIININDIKNNLNKKEKQENRCNTQGIIIVNWTSMTPMIKNWEKLTHLPYFYECNNVKNWDVITYDFAWNDNLLLKKIMGIPWDKFEYNWSNIFINDVVLKNSVWKKYNIKSKMLAMYSKSYPVIPDEAYLILWDKTSWTKDSSKFWLWHIDQIVWKVLPNDR